ncbi:MAG: antibiotic biosynthesis monooxygenase [Alphaproteobacteria bacterium 32-64-14]|nr:MAG: antibiotic biosynthesis monooxygenase [Alphaproteobacteria bacterium 32-64-14]
MMNQRKITAILRARAGKEAQLESLLRQLAVASRLEAGNLRWDIWQDQADAGTFVLDELYADDAAVLAHRATPHFQTYLASINDLAERTPIVSRPLDVI